MEFKVPGSFLLTSIKPSQPPPDSTLMSDAQALLDASRSWQAGKTYHSIRTSSHREYNENTRTSQTWHCVVNVLHKNVLSFSKLWSKLGRNTPWNEKRYVPGVTKVARIKYISEWQSIWTVSCILPPPMSPRVYTVYQASWLLEYSHRRRGIVITLPVDLSSRSTRDLAEMEERGVRGRYMSVEHLQEIDRDTVEWRRVWCVDPGGLIPKFWAQRKIEKRMVEDSLSCMEWLKTLGPEAREDTFEDVDAQQIVSSDHRGCTQRKKEEADGFHYRDGGTGTNTTLDDSSR